MFFFSKLDFLVLYLLFWQFGLAGNLIMKIQISLTILPKCLNWQMSSFWGKKITKTFKILLMKSFFIVLQRYSWGDHFGSAILIKDWFLHFVKHLKISDAHGVGICRVSRDDGNADLFSFLTHLGYITRLKSIRITPEGGITKIITLFGFKPPWIDHQNISSLTFYVWGKNSCASSVRS